jgi:nitrite reductase (NO-forming)
MTAAARRLSRRHFLAQVPLATAAAAACARTGPRDDQADAAISESQRPSEVFNSSSRLDTAILQGPHAATGVPAVNAAAVAFRRYDPALPPLSTERTIRVHWSARELPVRISPQHVVAAWTFEGNVPGPVLHVRQGDTVEFTLTNEGDVPHSMDFHCAQINPRIAFRSVGKGDSVTFSFTPRYPGAFMYHCGTAPVLMHIGAGMYGAIIVSPAEPLPPAREFVLVQSEFYLSDGPGGISTCDYRKMATTLPDHVVFNGRHDQYVAEPIRVKRGDRVRFFVVSAGPTHPCNFHVVGEVFDTVYPGAPPQGALRGVQTCSVAPGGGMIFDLIADNVGEFPFVNHGFGHGQKGAIGFLVVEE